MKKTIAINTEFLDRLEEFFIDSYNITHVIIKGEEPEEKDNIYFCASSNSKNNFEEKEIYVKEFINYLKNPTLESSYNFCIFVSRKSNDESIHDYLLSLCPSDQDLLLIYSKTTFLEEDTLAFFELFKEKCSLKKALKMGGNNTIGLSNDSAFLEKCFNNKHNFQFSTEEYYDIFFHYIRNSKYIYLKDQLFDFFTQRIDNTQLLESLYEQLYNSKISLDKIINSKSVEKIEITTFSLIKKYKYITPHEIENLLSFFVKCITQYIDKLSSTFRIQYFKEIKTPSDLTEYNLIIETNNIEECRNLLDLYLSYFVYFNGSSDSFIKNIKQKPYIFENLILCNKI